MEEVKTKDGGIAMTTKLYWRSIKNEIDAVTYKIAALRADENRPDLKAEMQTGVDVMEENYCYRKVDEAVLYLQGISGVIENVDRIEDEEREELNDRLHKTVTCWDISVDMERVKETDEQLTAMFHRFVVLKVLCDWLGMTVGDAAKVYQDEYTELKSEVELMSLGTPRKRKREPRKETNDIEIQYE